MIFWHCLSRCPANDGKFCSLAAPSCLRCTVKVLMINNSDTMSRNALCFCHKLFFISGWCRRGVDIVVFRYWCCTVTCLIRHLSFSSFLVFLTFSSSAPSSPHISGCPFTLAQLEFLSPTLCVCVTKIDWVQEKEGMYNLGCLAEARLCQRGELDSLRTPRSALLSLQLFPCKAHLLELVLMFSLHWGNGPPFPAEHNSDFVASSQCRVKTFVPPFVN